MSLLWMPSNSLTAYSDSGLYPAPNKKRTEISCLRVNVLKALKPQQKFIFTGGITALIGSYFVYNGFLGKHNKNAKQFYCRKAKNCNSRKCK